MPFLILLNLSFLKEKVEKVFSFPHGLELPSLSPLYEKKEKSTSKEDKEEERNMTDAELLKKDVVKVSKFLINKIDFKFAVV